MKCKTIQIYLFISGLILITVGSYISFTPLDYMNQFGIQVSGNTSLLSDLRAMGGSLIVFGLIALWGNFHKPAQLTSLLVSSVVYSAYAIFRLIAFTMDGTPETLIILASVIELTLAISGWYLVAHTTNTTYTSFEVHP